MEDIVEEVLEHTLLRRKDACKCRKCKLDIMALALNRLPPKYVVTQKGRVYTKLQGTDLQFKADVIREIVRAIGQIKNNPQH